MKHKAFKWTCFLLTAALAFALTACGSSSAGSSSSAGAGASEDSPSGNGEAEGSADSPDPKENGGSTLVVYFTWSGNTREMASYIAEQTGGDLLELEPATPYPEDYNKTGDLAKTERDEDQRPEIANLPDTIWQYDTILVGYPIWWHTAPMIIGTFLESYDLTGK